MSDLLDFMPNNLVWLKTCLCLIKLFWHKVYFLKDTKSVHKTIVDDQRPSLKHWLLLLFLSVVWGSSYILIKKGLIAYSPEQLACLRICISGLAFLPLFVLRFKSIDWSKIKYIAVVGFAGSFFPAFLFAFAQTELSSSTTGVLSSLTPLFTLLLGLLFFKFPFSWPRLIGVILGLAGAVSLILFGDAGKMSGQLFYGILVLLGCLFYALSGNTLKAALQELNVITISAVAFMMISLPALFYLFSTDFLEVLQTDETALTSLGYIAILALFGTVLASVLYFRLIQMTNPVFGSTVSYLIPIVALGWGALDGEVIGILHLLGMVLILGGVYISGK